MSKGYKKATVKQKPVLNHVADDERTNLIPSDAEVQNFQSARVYVFGDADVGDDEINNDELEMPTIRSRGKPSNGHPAAESQKRDSVQMEILERPISEGDTLQKIALKFRVQVAELKRVNNLIRDQDFFALQTIKVPIKSHGLISEIVEQEEKEQQKLATAAPGVSASLNGPSRISSGADIEEHHPYNDHGSETDYDLNSETEETKNLLLVRTLSIRDSLGKNSQSKEAQDFLCKMDADINKIVKSTVSRKDNLQDVTSMLTCKRIQPLQGNKSLLSRMSGADCGVRWWSMVALMLFVGLLTPIIIFVLYESTHKKEDSSSSPSPPSLDTVLT